MSLIEVGFNVLTFIYWIMPNSPFIDHTCRCRDNFEYLYLRVIISLEFWYVRTRKISKQRTVKYEVLSKNQQGEADYENAFTSFKSIQVDGIKDVRLATSTFVSRKQYSKLFELFVNNP